MESRIKQLREKRGLIQEILAAELGITQQMLSCPAAHCGRRKTHGIFSRFAYPIVPCRDLPHFSPGMAAHRRSLV